MSLRDSATRYARQYGIDPVLYHRLIQQESGWNPNAVSSVGARGLTQIMPDTARDPGWGVKPVNMASEDDQLRFGAEYLSKMIDRYDGDTSKALAAYNWGAGNADKWGGDTRSLPEETRNYLASILGGGDTPGFAPAESAGLGDTYTPMLPPEPEEPDYGEGRLGDAMRWRDQKRAAVLDKLGMTDDSAQAWGRALSAIGSTI